MFTGIIETTGIVKEVISNGSNRSFWIQSPVSGELKIDQSVSHDGVCLTVDEMAENAHRVTSVEETLQKTTLSGWVAGTKVNMERCLKIGDRLDGHLVQGHVDTTAVCTAISEKDGSRDIRFQFPASFAEWVVEKGSVCVNGISLTAFDTGREHFTVTIIPYTFHHTNISLLKEGDLVNIEFDLIGKYILRRLSLREE